MSYGQFSRNSNDPSSQIRRTGITGRNGKRRVFDNAMTAHTWAAQSQDDGRSYNGNFYFRGATIYSYRDSWPLASFVTINGRAVCIVNDERYSVSTSCHSHDVRNALRGSDVAIVTTNDVSVLRRVVDSYDDESRAAAYAAIVAEYVAALEKRAAEYAKPSKSIYGVDSAFPAEGEETWQTVCADRCNALANNDIARVAALLDVTPPAIDIEGMRAKIREAFAAFYDPAKVAKREKDRAKRAARSCVVTVRKLWPEIKGGGYVSYRTRERFNAAFSTMIQTRPEKDWRAAFDTMRAALYASETDATLDARFPDRQSVIWDRKHGDKRERITADQWINGADGTFYQESPTLVRRKGDMLETSRNADAPFSQAVEIYKLAAHCRRNAKSYQRNGHKLHAGAFTLDSIDTAGNIRIGCHTIAFDEMTRLACREISDLVMPNYPLPAIIP